jgi:perosamine synthetase
MPELTRVPLSEPVFGDTELEYLRQCIAERWVAGKGRFVREFEERFAERHGRPAAVSTNSGTAALHVALVELGIGPGDEVIVPALTFVATANAVSYVGATPVFVDVDPATYTIDPASLEAAVTARTRAVIVVHLYGHPADMDAIAAIARARDLAVIEDATEALGSTYRDAPCGTLADVGCFSFNGNKVITSGGGGMVLAREPARLDHMRHLTVQARIPGTREYLHDEVGFNYGLSNLQAAVGLAQLERLDAMVEARRALGARYAAGLAGVEDLTFCAEAPWARSNHWLMSVLVDPAVAGRDRDDVMDALANVGVEARPFFTPLSSLPPFRDDAAADTPVARMLHERGVSIPSSADLDASAQERVIAVLRDG